MGFKYYSDNVKCPLFSNKIHTKHGKFQGVECIAKDNTGFEYTHVLRFKKEADTDDWIGIFCKDLFESCPYYQQCTQRDD